MTGVVGVIATVIAFYLWFSLTIAILCIMEGTSAMVEAMSKHFMGDGVALQPFSFKILLEEDADNS